MATDLILSNPGERPVLTWLPIEKLDVDGSYQRNTNSTRSQKLIRHIAAKFSWSKFQVLTVTPKPAEGWEVPGWLIIDGQHRAAGALLRGDIEQLPCVVLDLPDRAAQAEAFVALNRDRVAINRMQMHHAALAAGDTEAAQIDALCKACGVEISRYPVPRNILKPQQTLAISTIQKLMREIGGEPLSLALRTIRLAWPSRPALAADLISGMTVLFASHKSTLDQGHLVTVLRAKDPDAWIEAGRQRKYAAGGRFSQALIAVITRAYNAKAGGDRLKLPEAA